MSSAKKPTYEFGVLCETISCDFLRLKGYTIIAQRYKSKLGEIDIIAKKDKTVVFIEVKARKKEELLEITLRQKQVNRIRKAAQFFIATHPQYHNFDMRFDFILFTTNLIPQHFEAFF